MKQAFVSKYEATKCMKQHIISIHQSEPSKETSRWRDSHEHAPVKHSKHQQYHKMDAAIEAKNKMLSDRMYKVVTEDRVHRTKEAGPGWRSGIGGTVIDCYPTENKQVLYYKKFRNENRDRAIQWKQHQLNEANVEFYSYLAATKTSYGVDQLAKEYEKNRVSYNLYANRPNTALTLGIYDVAAKEITKEKLKRTGYRNNLKYSSSELNHKIEEIWEKKKNSGGNKIMKKLNDIKSVADFIDLNVTSIEEKWNPTVNNNLRNSASNLAMIEGRLKPGYVNKREFQSNYLNDVPTTNEVLRQLHKSCSEQQQLLNGSMKVDYDRITFDKHVVRDNREVSRSTTTLHNHSHNNNHNNNSSSRPSTGGYNRPTTHNDLSTNHSSRDFNLYDPKGTSPPPPRINRPKPVANAIPTVGGTMQFADSSGVRDLAQFQHSIEEVSEFNFQNLKAEFLEHYFQDDDDDIELHIETADQQLHRKTGSPLKGKRPSSAGPVVMKVRHTKATAAAVVASLLPEVRPTSPKYALPKTKPRSRSNSPSGKRTSDGGGAAPGITFHDDPAEYLQFDQFDSDPRRKLSYDHVHSPSPSTFRNNSDVNYTNNISNIHSNSHNKKLQRPHSTGRSGLPVRRSGEYRDYSGGGGAGGGSSGIFNTKKNVSFDNKLDSLIIYSQTSDSQVGVGSSSLDENIANVVFMNQYG